MTSSKRKKRAGSTTASVKVTLDGPYLVSGPIPLIQWLIVSDSHGTATAWRELTRYPPQETYALCRCGKSGKKPYCDGTHGKLQFKGKETASESYLKKPKNYVGLGLELIDYEPLCASARFCRRAGGIWKLIKKAHDPDVKRIVLQEVADCPSGRLVLKDRGRGSETEPTFPRSIVVIEDPAGGGMGPYWVRGSVPVMSSEGRVYEIRNRVTLCRCGKSGNKPFCDSSHYTEQPLPG